MQNSKLVHFLSLFSAAEIERFKLFLSSPYFNTSPKLLQFFKYIEPHHPAFNSPKLDKEKIYLALHGKKSKYNDQTMRELISDMMKLAKTFAAHEQLEKSELEIAKQRFLWVSERNSEKMQEEEVGTATKLLEKYAKHDAGYYEHQWLNDYHRFKIMAERLDGAEHKIMANFDLTKHVHSLNRFYLNYFFEVNIYLLALAKIYNQPVDEKLVEHIDALAKNYINKGDTSIDLFYNCFQLYRTGEEKYFEELKSSLFKNDASVSKIAMNECAVALENYCIKRMRLGDLKYGNDIIDIYRFEVEQGLCIDNGKINYIFYQNVAGLGFESNQLDWVEDFVEKYREYVPEEYREEIYCYARAHILFARKRYIEALRMALAANTSHFFWNKILLRNLVARTQYELGMFAELQLEIDSYKHHLADEKVSEIWRKNTRLYTNAILSLVDLNFSYSKDKVQKFKEHLDSETQLQSKRWFRDKLAEIENKKKRN